MNSTLELGAVLAIILLPTLPASVYFAGAVGRRRTLRSEAHDVATIAVALTVLARALA